MPDGVTERQVPEGRDRLLRDMCCPASASRGLEHSTVALAVPLGEGLHHPVNLLCLPREPEAPQELPQGLDKVQVRELMQLHEGVQDLDVKLISIRNRRRQGGRNQADAEDPPLQVGSSD